MSETYQEQKENEKTEAEINFATIGAIYSDGVTLIFDGQTEATEKHYKCNSFAVFSAGQRVKITKDSGTYVVEYPVGNPRTSFTVDSANTANTATNASNAYKLNNKSESELAVLKAQGVVDQTYSSGVVQFYSSGGNFYIRSSMYSTWKKITIT